MNPRHVISLCLLVVGLGVLTAWTPRKVKADKYGVCESASAQLLSKVGLRGHGRAVLKCRVAQASGRYELRAKALLNDSAVHIVKPWLRLMLADGDSVVLRPERRHRCCSEWADGRWYNASFPLSLSDVERLKSSEVVAVCISSDRDEIVREVASGRGDALSVLLQSVEAE